MGFLTRDNHHISSHDAFSITEQGKDKLQEFNGDPGFQVLAALESHGSAFVDEITRYTGLSGSQVEKWVKRLQHGGYIQNISSARYSDG